jgi:hypothetical protein
LDWFCIRGRLVDERAIVSLVRLRRLGGHHTKDITTDINGYKRS